MNEILVISVEEFTITFMKPNLVVTSKMVVGLGDVVIAHLGSFSDPGLPQENSVVVSGGK